MTIPTTSVVVTTIIHSLTSQCLMVNFRQSHHETTQHALYVKIITLLALLLGMNQVVNAQAIPQLTKMKGRNYTIYTDLPPKSARPFATHMDTVFDQYKKRFRGFISRDKREMPLYLFQTEKDYLLFLAKNGIDGKNTGGMFFLDRNIHGLATFLTDGDRLNTLRTLQHEGFHQFAYVYIGHNLPLWANEGLAEYFENGIVVGRRMKLGYAKERKIELLRTAMEKDALIDFDQLLAIAGEQWGYNLRTDLRLGHLQYAQSWSLVHFLIHGDNGRYQAAFEKYLRLVGKGRPSVSAFRAAFGVRDDTTAFRQRWEAYLKTLRADPLSAAVDRMEHLGMLILKLHKDGHKIPQTMDDLRRQVDDLGYQLQRRPCPDGSQDGDSEFRIDELFTYTTDSAESQAFELLEPRANNLLPRITAAGLKPRPTLDWSEDDRKQLVPDINYQ